MGLVRSYLGRLIAIAALCGACSGANFSSGDPKAKSKHGRGAGNTAHSDIEGANASGIRNPDPFQGVDGADGAIKGPLGNSDDIFGGDGSKSLPRNCVNQSLLVLDFKSGWWEVSGADETLGFRDLAVNELSQMSCVGTRSIVEYHHILRKSNMTRFYENDFKTYTQVWILSGTVGDDGDIAVNDPGLLDLIAQIKTYKPRLFLGAGFGSIDHSNAVASGIFGVPFFRADYVSDHSVVTDVRGSNVSVKTRFNTLPAGGLFTGLTGPLPDQLAVGFMDYAAADEIATTLAGVTILAKCQSNPYVNGNVFMGTTPVRDIACIAVGKNNGYEFVLDSGLGKFYTLYSDPATKAYFRNILRALAL